MPVIHLSCLYDQNPETYEGIELCMALGAESEVFNTGVPYHDYLVAATVAHARAGPDALIFGTSSIDHFVMDGGDLPDGTEATEEQVDKAAKAAKAYLTERGE